jgi:hypothetical protein
MSQAVSQVSTLPTPAHRRVLLGLSLGLEVGQIVFLLKMKVEVVQRCMDEIHACLGVKSNEQAVSEAFRRGYLKPIEWREVYRALHKEKRPPTPKLQKPQVIIVSSVGLCMDMEAIASSTRKSPEQIERSIKNLRSRFDTMRAPDDCLLIALAFVGGYVAE